MVLDETQLNPKLDYALLNLLLVLLKVELPYLPWVKHISVQQTIEYFHLLLQFHNFSSHSFLFRLVNDFVQKYVQDNIS